jgi:hypothetical protein
MGLDCAAGLCDTRSMDKTEWFWRMMWHEHEQGWESQWSETEKRVITEEWCRGQGWV